MLCKQCKLTIENCYMIRWVVTSKVKVDNKVTVNNRTWDISKVWHSKQDSKYLFNIVKG